MQCYFKPGCLGTRRNHMYHHLREACFVCRPSKCFEIHFRSGSLFSVLSSITFFLLEHFCGPTKNRFAAFLVLLTEQSKIHDRALEAETRIQLVVSDYVAQCQCSSRNDLVISSNVLIKENEQKFLVRIVASFRFYGEGKTKCDVVVNQNDEKQNCPKSNNRLSTWLGKVLTFAKFARRQKLKMTQLLGMGIAVTEGNFDISSEGRFVQY